MNSLEVIRYEPSLKDEWDGLIHGAANATFMLQRDFMEYHADRFSDHSLLIRKNGQAVAVLPANEKNTTVFSHQGLSYAGLLVSPMLKTVETMECVWQAVAYFSKKGFRKLIWKKTPEFYHSQPVFGEDQALYQVGATIAKMEANAVLDLSQTFKFQERRHRGHKKAIKVGLVVDEAPDWAIFWQMLTNNLRDRHQVSPTHTLEEMQRLHKLFPKHIRLHTVSKDGQMLGGAVVYRNKEVAHSQYIASTSQGRDFFALDLLFKTLILSHKQAGFRYFSFGVSTEPSTGEINTGLMAWKESWGARARQHLVYEIELPPCKEKR